MFWKGERSGGQSVQESSGAGGLWRKHTIFSSLPAAGDTWWADFSWSLKAIVLAKMKILSFTYPCIVSMTYFPLWSSGDVITAWQP